MGELIRIAGEERGMSRVALAKENNRRPATISLIENGKSEISVITLMLSAIALQKPISYFFPPSLLKDWIVDIKTPFEQKCLEFLRGIEHFGDEKLTYDLLKLLHDHFEEDFESTMSGYPEEAED
jgi:transcriptional regulator with XRE-family HTH domain